MTVIASPSEAEGVIRASACGAIYAGMSRTTSVNWPELIS
jgi:hypothetical protein